MLLRTRAPTPSDCSRLSTEKATFLEDAMSMAQTRRFCHRTVERWKKTEVMSQRTPQDYTNKDIHFGLVQNRNICPVWAENNNDGRGAGSLTTSQHPPLWKFNPTQSYSYLSEFSNTSFIHQHHLFEISWPYRHCHIGAMVPASIGLINCHRKHEEKLRVFVIFISTR